MRKTILFAGLILLLVLVSSCLPSQVPEEKPAPKPVLPTTVPPEEREALTVPSTAVTPEEQEARQIPSTIVPKKEPEGMTMKFRFANEAKSDATLIAFVNGEKIYEKKFTATVGEGQCIDNLQCESDQHCLDGRCSSLSTLYKKAIGSQNCGRICDTYYALIVSTSDKETYNVKPKRGSYSCAGALEWKIMENAKHCQSERAVVPIMIIMKEPGKVLSEQVITLQRRESKEVQHPTLPHCKLGLTIEEIYELCEE